MVWRPVRGVAVLIAAGSPIVSHVALAFGRGYGAALLLAALQAVAGGVVLWGAWPRWRWAGPVLAVILLAALGAGAARSPEAGLLAAAGVGHAVLYGALLAVFGASLLPGRVSLVTGIASRLNPTFHAGMVPYTRAVTAAWCGLFAGQLVASGVLLATEPGWWRALVTTVHVPIVAGMALVEYGVRRWRWRHEHYTSLRDTVSGVRRMWSGRPLDRPH